MIQDDSLAQEKASDENNRPEKYELVKGSRGEEEEREGDLLAWASHYEYEANATNEHREVLWIHIDEVCSQCKRAPQESQADVDILDA